MADLETTTVDPTDQRCGFVALVGAPNAGKSTLLNALVGSKVSIVSPKVQTTRARVLGIALEKEAQIVFIDTPGIFQAAKKRLELRMVEAAWRGAEGADAIVLVVDAQRGFCEETRAIAEKLKGQDSPLILALNKVDTLRREKLLPLAAQALELAPFAEVFMISALSGSGVGDLRKSLAHRAPPGPWHYPEDQLADMPLRLMAAEFTREQLFVQLHDELPYDLTVETESWLDKPDGSVRVEQAITVMRESQRAIVLGKAGRRIKAVGAAARQQLSEALDRTVHLFLHVRIRENWQEDPEHYRAMGLDYE